MQPENKGMFELIEHACLGMVRLPKKKIAGNKSRKERHVPHHRTCLLGNGLIATTKMGGKFKTEKKRHVLPLRTCLLGNGWRAKTKTDGKYNWENCIFDANKHACLQNGLELSIITELQKHSTRHILGA